MPNINKRELVKTGVAIALGTSMASLARAGEAPASIVRLNQAVPSFDIARNGRGRFSDKSFKGKTTIVEFWGLWCSDCLADGDNTAAAAKLARSNGIEFMAIHTRGRYGRWGTIDAYFKEKGYYYSTAIDDDSAVFKAFELAWVPTYLIIDKNGIIRDFTTDLGPGIGVNGLINKAINVKKSYK